MKININNNEHDGHISEDGNILLNDNSYNVELLNSYSKDVHTFSVNNKIYTISTSKGEDSTLKIHHDGSLYEVNFKTDKEALLEKYMAGSGSAANKDKVIKAPMPGLVVKINNKVGDTIKKGDKPIVIEAMKMENALASPGSGTIKAINVSEGQAVEKNTILIELE